MSTWITIDNQDDIEIDDSVNTIDIYIGSDDFGANYVSIPIGFILNVLKDNGDL